jgi:tetratricopeptide (TPR) repeat protein
MSRRLLIALVLAHASVAAAQGADSPWSRGVTDEQKKTAQGLLEQGNQLMLASKFKEAVPIYERALASWDHPAIRFNLVKALIGLDKVLDAAENLDKALAYGAAPLEDQVYNEALNYQRLLKNQIATIELRCDQAGVKLALDGKPALTCPGTRELRVLPGAHSIVGAGPSLVTEVRDVTLIGGTRTSESFALREPGEPVRRWATWKPWAVVAGGAAFTATGVVFNVLARNRRDDLHARAATQCSVRGCDAERYEELGLRALEDRVNAYNTVSMIALGVGGAGMIAGGVLVMLNRVSPEAPRVAVQPGATGVTVTVGGSF